MDKLNNKQIPILLASASPRRAELLGQIGVAFLQIPADIDESPISGESPHDYVVRIAMSKCKAIQKSYPDQVILASDTVVVANQQILGKPQNEQEHKQMFALLSGRTHDVLTAVTVAKSEAIESQVERSLVTFQDLPDELVTAYWRSGEPADKAGGYAIQGKAATFIKKLEGSYSGVMGLPLELTARMLGKVGIDMWSDF